VNAVAAQVQAILDEAVRTQQLPGAVAIFGSRTARSTLVTAGVEQLGGAPVSAQTRYDLASLTKVVSTLPCVLRLCADGALSLDDRVSRFISNAGWFQTPSLGNTTIRELLTHTSGLAAWRPVYADTSDRLTALGNVLQSAIGERGAIVYSDLGFITLGAIIERVTGLRQDVFARQAVFEPLGMTNTGYGPVTGAVAATEDCGWRNTLLRGVVHDENAHRLDGVAGHAGLFGTAADLATYAQAWLTFDPRLGSAPLLADARREHVADGQRRRGLGWLLKGEDSFAGAHGTLDGHGHTGFTGTSMWIEPHADWFAVLLSNRVHPSRTGGPGMHGVRRAFHEAVAHALPAQE
jgi:CubicO group peptidase (beta-lactamase class C family)